MIYSKDKLIEIVRPYFKNSKIDKLLVTEDAQVFYENCVDFAQSHTSVNKLRPPYIILRSDLENKSDNIEKSTPLDDDKIQLIEYAQSIGVKVDKRMGIEKIESLIKDKEDARE